MAKLDASTVLAIASDIETAVATGKLIFGELTAFLASKGVDLEKLEANRAQLIADLNSLKTELGQL